MPCRYRSITKQFFRKADGMVVICDITMEDSFRSVRPWLASILEAIGDPIPVIHLYIFYLLMIPIVNQNTFIEKMCSVKLHLTNAFQPTYPIQPSESKVIQEKMCLFVTSHLFSIAIASFNPPEVLLASWNLDFKLTRKTSLLEQEVFQLTFTETVQMMTTTWSTKIFKYIIEWRTLAGFSVKHVVPHSLSSSELLWDHFTQRLYGMWQRPDNWPRTQPKIFFS